MITLMFYTSVRLAWKCLCDAMCKCDRLRCPPFYDCAIIIISFWSLHTEPMPDIWIIGTPLTCPPSLGFLLFLRDPPLVYMIGFGLTETCNYTAIVLKLSQGLTEAEAQPRWRLRVQVLRWRVSWELAR